MTRTWTFRFRECNFDWESRLKEIISQSPSMNVSVTIQDLIIDGIRARDSSGLIEYPYESPERTMYEIVRAAIRDELVSGTISDKAAGVEKQNVFAPITTDLAGFMDAIQ